MNKDHPAVRLRQAVWVATELDPVAERLRAELGLGEPFADPGVATFGLVNAVFALGDTFLEVVAPTRADTAAGRYLERRGPGGYMLIFQLADLDGARARAETLSIRVVWQVDLPDISGTHLHPGDTDGAIVSLDRPQPAGSWRWGGPDWTGKVGTGAPGGLIAATVSVTDPAAVAARWGEVLGVQPDGGSGRALDLDGGEVSFVGDGPEGRQGLTGITVAVPDAVRRGRDQVAIGGVVVNLRTED